MAADRGSGAVAFTGHFHRRRFSSREGQLHPYSGHGRSYGGSDSGRYHLLSTDLQAARGREPI